LGLEAKSPMWYEAQGNLTPRIEIQQAVHLGVHEPEHDLGRQPRSCRNGQQICQQGAAVPTEMAIGAGLVFPGVSPIRSRADDRSGRSCHRRFHRGRLRQISAKITLSQKPQSHVRRVEVIYARVQAREVASHDIQFDLVESSGAGCGAKVDYSPRMFSLLGNSRREVQDTRQIREVRDRIGARRGHGL